MDIEKFKNKYRNQGLGIRDIGDVQTQPAQPELLQSIEEVRGQILAWAKAKKLEGMETKEVKDIALIVNGIANSLQPAEVTLAPQVNVLVQNFIDSKPDDC